LHKRLQFENQKRREHMRVLGVDARIILKWILRRGVRVWTGFTLLTIGSKGGLL
jgi:hypothetical protein